MFNHVFLGTNDIDTSRKFYDATMGALGFDGHPLPHGTVYPSGEGSLIVAKPANGDAMSVSNGHTLGLKAKSYDEVDAWHQAGLAAGHEAAGAVVLVGPDLHARQRDGKGRVSPRLRRARRDFRRTGHQPAR